MTSTLISGKDVGNSKCFFGKARQGTLNTLNKHPQLRFLLTTAHVRLPRNERVQSNMYPCSISLSVSLTLLYGSETPLSTPPKLLPELSLRCEIVKEASMG